MTVPPVVGITMNAELITHEAGRTFCVMFEPADEVRRRVLVVPAFAEEMNRTRPLVARAARALAADGAFVLVPDLLGTGDAPGDFGDADWEGWQEEVGGVQRYLGTRLPRAPEVLLTVRSGVLLLGSEHLTGAHLVCWQPVVDGWRFLQQFLRLRVMAAKFAGISESAKELTERIAAGECVEVAGYTLSSGLTDGLAAALLEPELLSKARRVDMFEICSTAGDIGRALKTLAARVREYGGTAEAQLVLADQFWAAQEISVPEAVVSATVAACRSAS